MRPRRARARGQAVHNVLSHGRAAHIPRPVDLPKALQELLKSPSFCDNIRRYNAATGFVSFGDASGGTAAARIPGQGPPVYVLHGQVYHRISVLLPSGNKDPAYGQLYIYDPVEAADRRAKIDPGLGKLLRKDSPNADSLPKSVRGRVQTHVREVALT